MPRTACRIYALTLALILIGLTGGCSSLAKFPKLGKSKPAPPVEFAPDQPTVKVKLVESGEEPRRLRLALREGMLVEDAIKSVGADRDFRHMSLVVFRTLPDGKQMKLDIHYDPKKNRVEPAYNYALLPDDLILVEKIVVTPLDALLNSVSDPLVDRYRR